MEHLPILPRGLIACKQQWELSILLVHMHHQLSTATGLGLQMVELPDQHEGLSWIVSQGSSQLLLIPGVQAANLTAAAAGDAQALAYLRFAAQNYAGPGAVTSTPLNDMCCAASDVSSDEEQTEFERLFDNAELRGVFDARRNFTMKLLLLATQQGRLAALKWLRALCHQTWRDDDDLMEAAAEHGHLPVLKFLRSGPCPASWWYDLPCYATAHPDCFQWLCMQRDWEWEPEMLASLAANGNIPGLQLLRDHPDVQIECWNANVTTAAARGRPFRSAAMPTGNLEVLQWLRSQDPPLSMEWVRMLSSRRDRQSGDAAVDASPGPTMPMATARVGRHMLSSRKWGPSGGAAMVASPGPTMSMELRVQLRAQQQLSKLADWICCNGCATSNLPVHGVRLAPRKQLPSQLCT